MSSDGDALLQTGLGARMSGATMLNIRVAPRRMLSLREAADYCGIASKKFAITGIAHVAMPHGQNLYDIKDLDAWLDGLKNNALDSDVAIIGKLGQCRT